MSRISQAFDQKQPFIGYLTAGDATKERFLSLLEMGVTILEIGIPFSDPVADGVVIQKAMERALQTGTTPDSVLELVSAIRRESEVAIVLFTYLNPIQKDVEGFLTRAKRAGADGILIIDLPIEESTTYRQVCQEVGLLPIFVIAPSTPPARIATICELAQGFIYYACRKGTTGARNALPEDLADKIGIIRGYTDLPIAVGFGISNRETADAVLTIADGFVVGSHLVEGNRL